MLGTILFYSFVIMLASLVGVFSVWKKAGKTIERNLHFLVSFSAGVFLIITIQLGNETLEHAETLGTGLFWIVAGMVGVWALFKFLPFFHHHHDDTDENSITHSKIDARKILLSDAVHNLGDGILLATAFGIDVALGIITALSILVHELVQEISEFFVLKKAGYTTYKALKINFLVSSTILLGALGSFFLMETFEIFEVPLLGIAAGAFLIVVAHDLIPHSIKSPTFKTHYFKHLIWFLLGIVIMTTANSLVVHTHDNEHETQDLQEEQLEIV